MEDFWDILIPVLIIGGVIAGGIADSMKKQKKPAIPPVATPVAEARETQESATVKHRERKKQTPKPQYEGMSTIKTVPADDEAYSMKQSDAGVAMEDLRKAIVAHEILKRKF